MKYFDWDPIKNEWLKEVRGACFDDVIVAINEGGLLDAIPNPSGSHKGQLMLVVRIRDYVYTVPFVEDEEKVFLKTVIPNRKVAKKYLTGNK